MNGIIVASGLLAEADKFDPGALIALIVVVLIAIMLN